MSKIASKETQDLIDSLVERARPTRGLAHPLLRFIPWLAFAIIYMVCAIYVLGVRPDLEGALHDPLYLFEISLVAVMAIFSAVGAHFLCIPDMRGQKWLLNVSFCLFAVFMLWTGMRVLFEFSIQHIHWHRCQMDSIILGIIPAIAIWYLSMRGKTTHPYLLSFMNTLAIGGLGYIGLRITCMADGIDHLCYYHIVPYLVLGAIAGLIGRRIYRW